MNTDLEVIENKFFRKKKLKYRQRYKKNISKFREK